MLLASFLTDLHHFYTPRMVADVFAEFYYLETLLGGVPGCLRCVLARSKGYAPAEKCGYPVAKVEEGEWHVKECWKVRNEWDEMATKKREEMAAVQ